MLLPNLRRSSPVAAADATHVSNARAQAAARYDLEVLRLGSIAPPTLPARSHATARDGDLARVDAQARYAQVTHTRQQVLAAARDMTWRNMPKPTMSPTNPTRDVSPAAVKGRLATRQIAKNLQQMKDDHAFEHTVGQGVGYGFVAVAAEALPQLMAVRLASGLRWAGAAQSAVVAGRLAEHVSWAGAATEGELIGARAAWQGYKTTPWKAVRKQVIGRVFLDLTGQGVANYIGSDYTGLDGAVDAAYSVNLIETGMAAYGLRPVGIGAGSALLQFSINKKFKTPLDGSVSTRAFLAQAAIGTGLGYVGIGTEKLLTKRLAFLLYHKTALRMGYDVGYPVWLGSSHLFLTGVPAGLGITEEHLENKAQDRWPTKEDSLKTKP